MEKIIIFSTAYLPLIGGAEIAVKEITDRVKNFEFHLLTARFDKKFPKKEKIGNVKIHRLGLGYGALDKFLLPFLSFFKACQLDKKNNFQIIWSIMASQASIGAAFFKIFKPSKKLLLTLQEGDEEKHLKRYVFNLNFLYKILIKPWHSLVFKKADYMTAISGHLKKRALQNRVKCKIDIIPNGVDLNKFSICNPPAGRAGFQFAKEDLKKDLGFLKQEKIIITISRLVEKNGIEDLIMAVSKLQIPNLKLLILGKGELEKKLKKIVKELNLKDRVKFLGLIPQDKLPRYLWASDVFCRPSLSEGLGNVFLEAMAAGVPVLTTPVGGIPDFLKEEKTGWFCEANNPRNIARKIEYILDEKNQAKIELAKDSALKLVQKKYNWEKISKDMNEIFKKL